MKKQTCLRGHDTSYPESRTKQGVCRQCKYEIHERKYVQSEKGKIVVARKHKKYDATEKRKIVETKRESLPARIYYKVKLKLKYSIFRKRLRIDELERSLA